MDNNNRATNCKEPELVRLRAFL
ncbi:protein of unknown function [Cupriavidus neocaledonicus]|uniref:Uncharacterized protein n=1 Tax=Cupriavidus neocaledonicus TaxID=1040979 RepID=A0A375H449_9BURK|nr:protein of unknown function [Cupriavidus neocaledonicus]